MLRLTFIWMLMSYLSYGQRHKECTIYTYSEKDTSCIIRQTFNKHGKITFEEKQYKLREPEKKAIRTYYYYTKDTLLSKSITQETPLFFNYDADSLEKYTEEELQAKMIDTTVTLYTYNPNRQLVQKKTAYYSYDQSGCYALSSRGWQDTAITSYTYDAHNHRKEERNNSSGIFMSANYFTYTHDEQKRLSKIQTYHIPPLDGDSTILISTQEYLYNSNGYQLITTEVTTVQNPWQHQPDTVTVQFVYDKQKRIIKETKLKPYKSGPSVTTKYYSYHPQQRIDREEYNSEGIVKETTMYIYK